MAKEDAAASLMPAAEMKPLLLLSKRDPVSAVVGLTKDKDGVVYLAKKTKPRKLVSQLRKRAADAGVELDASSLRFGRASVDPAADSALVTFTVNKEAAGALRPKLLGHLKKAGFSKCEIVVDPSLETEADEDEAAAGAAPAGGHDAAPAGAGAGAAGQEAPLPAGGAPDRAALTRRVTELARRMMGVIAANPPGADAMRTAALAAQAGLKSGDLAAAASAADTLERLLGAAAGGPAAGGASHANAAVLEKAQAAWAATRTKVHAEFDKLFAEIAAVYNGHGAVADIERSFHAKVTPALNQLDQQLTSGLRAISSNPDPGSHAQLVQEVHQVIARYSDYVAGEAVLSQLERNPFTPVAVQKTLSASLAALAKAVH